MPTPHCAVKIISRSGGQSAVAGSAYQSGEKLYSEYDQQIKDYEEKRGIIHAEIMLPDHAPPAYADRGTLWNAVEKVEKQWNSQLARKIEVAIPKEIPSEQYADLIRDYCREFFVSKGMCVDFAVHDVDGHNPHAHIMLTMRAIDENGNWLPKSRKVYDLDENGERIKLPSGNWKSHKENTVDWNEQSNCEIWRQGWADWQNRYLEKNNRPERIDLRSYERQGIEQIPMVHMGPAATAMERKGIQTDLGNLNREIQKLNHILKAICQSIKDLKNGIVEIRQKQQEWKAEEAAEEETQLPLLLMKYANIRKEERKDWNQYGKEHGALQDLKKVASAIAYLQQHDLRTVDDLEAHITQMDNQISDMKSTSKKNEARVKEINWILTSVEDYRAGAESFKKYSSIYFKKSKEKYKQEHPEVEKYIKAKAYLNKHHPDHKINQEALIAERDKLADEIHTNQEPLEGIKEELKKLKNIRYCVRKAIPGTEESKLPPPKQSLKEQMKHPDQTPKEPTGKTQKKEEIGR